MKTGSTLDSSTPLRSSKMTAKIKAPSRTKNQESKTENPQSVGISTKTFSAAGRNLHDFDVKVETVFAKWSVIRNGLWQEKPFTKTAKLVQSYSENFFEMKIRYF